jgi:hypothetical protein
MRIRTGGIAIALIAVAFTATVVPRADATAQPEAAPTQVVHVESTYVNMSVSPSFTFAISLPTLLHFRAVDTNGQRLLEILAISRVDSLQARIRRAASYEAESPGIFTPLIQPPNRGDPILAYVGRADFERALRAATLRALGYTYTLKYKRLT